MPDFDLIVRGGTAGDRLRPVRCGHRRAGRPHRRHSGPFGRRQRLIDADRPARAAWRRRQPLPYRAVAGGRDHRRGEFRDRQHRGRLRGGTTSVVSASRPSSRVAACWSRLASVPPPGSGGGDGGLRLPPDRHRSDRSTCIRTELPALVAGGIRSLKVFLTYDPLRLDDRQYLDVLCCRTPTRLPGDGALRELRRHRLARGGAAGGRPDGAEIPRLVPPRGGGAGGDASCHRLGRAGGPADRGVPRLRRRRPRRRSPGRSAGA